MLTAELLSWMIRVSLLFMSGCLIARWLARRSATMAHQVLITTALCAVLLPVLMIVVPVWTWTVPGWMVEHESDALDQQSDSAAEPREVPHQKPLPLPQPQDVSTIAPDPDVSDATSVTSGRAVGGDPATALDVPAPSVSPAVSPASGSPQTAGTYSWSRLISVLWLAITSLMFTRMLVAVFRLRSFLSRCDPADEAVGLRIREAANLLQLRRSIDIRVAGDNSMPLACWSGRWTIVVPANIQTWSSQMQNAAIVHELGHIARRDAWLDLFVQSVRSLLWLNPLVWLLVRDARRLRERACDEWVLRRSGIKAGDYARGVLDVVEQCRPVPVRLVSTMADSSGLESRLKWLVSEAVVQAHRPLTSILMLAGVLGLSVTIATGHPVAPEPVADEADVNTSDVDSQTVHPLNQVTVRSEPAPDSPAISIAGTVEDPDGQPLDGMTVVLRAMVRNSYSGPAMQRGDLLARTTTNADGRFQMDDIRIPPRMKHVIDSLSRGETGVQIVVWGPGKAITWQPIHSYEESDRTFRLQPEADVSGVVTDELGRPLHDATLTVTGMTANTESPSVFFYDPGDLRLYESEIRITTTSVRGAFSLPNIPKGMLLSMMCVGTAGQRAVLMFDTSDSTAAMVRFRDGARDERELLRTPIQAELEQLAWARLRITDHLGNPVPEGSVNATHQNRSYGGRADVGQDGTAMLAVNSPGRHIVYYGPERGTRLAGTAAVVDFRKEETPVVEIRLPQPHFITGRVIDSETGAGVPGVVLGGTTGSAVSFYENLDEAADLPPVGTAHAVSGGDGRFEMPATEGLWKITLRNERAGYLIPTPRAQRQLNQRLRSVDVMVSADESSDALILRISRGLSVRGVVTDEAGRPLAGVLVNGESQGGRYRNVATRTDDNGDFVLQGFSPFVPIHLVARTDSGAAQLQLEGNPDQAWEETLHKTVRLQLSAGNVVTGRVIRHGEPAVGVMVKLLTGVPQEPHRSGVRYRVTAESGTDVDGRYRLAGLQPGQTFQLEVETVGNTQVRDWNYQSPTAHTNRAKPGETIELPDAELVSNGQELRGIVVDLDGIPVTGIQVSARLASGGRLSRPQSGPPPWTETDDQGRFHLTNLPDQLISLMAYRSSPSGGPIHYPATAQPEMNDTDIRILLDPTLGSGIEDLDEP